MRKFGGIVIPAGIALISAGLMYAQFGRGGGDWTTSGNDAQRSSWVRSDEKISLESLEKPGFTMIWKVRLSQNQKSAEPLTDAVLMDRYIGYRGFRSYAFVGGLSNTVYALDSDLSRVEWRKTISAGSSSCGDYITQVARPTGLTIAAAGMGGGRGRGGFAKGNVGEPGQGANVAIVPRRNFVMPRPAPAGRKGGRASAVPNVFRRGPSYMYALTGDGMLHQMYVSNGDEPEPAFRFLPAGANASGLVVIDNVAYAVTTKGCGNVPEGIWALDLQSKKVSNWKGSVAGIEGMAFDPDGGIYVATGSGSGSQANSIVALDPETLQPKDWYTADSAFTSTPVLFEYSGKLLAAATTRDGRMHLVDTKSLGGADHKTPLAKSAVYSDASNFTPGALASWEDPQHNRWVLAPAGGPITSGANLPGNGSVTHGAIVAWKIADQNGTPSFAPGWVSRDMVSPLTPMIVNDVVFAISAGNTSTHAVLYALNPNNGKELYNSGSHIASFVRGGGLSEGGSQLYVGAADGTLYAFGFPMEH